jgi:hypothetical protein
MQPDERRAAEQACRDLVTALVHFADHGLAERAADLFAIDATWVRSGTAYTGRAEILRSFAAKAPCVIRHLTTCTLVELVDDCNATGVSYYLAYRHAGTSLDPLPLDRPVAMGEWHDHFVRTEAGWRFAHRRALRVFGASAQP